MLSLVEGKIQMTERSTRRLAEALRVCLEPRYEFLPARVSQRRHVLREEVHLLRQPALHDRVALIEAERQRLAVKDLLADFAVHEADHFLGTGGTPPLRGEGQLQLAEVILCHLDPAETRSLTRIAAQYAIHSKQRQADQ